MLANMVYRVSRLSSPLHLSLTCCCHVERRRGDKNAKKIRNTKADSQGYMKGYISHEKAMVVLAKTNPFPNLNSIAR